MSLDQTQGGRRRAPSMQDVARHAGVSAQTVSRVANGMNNVEEATRERVLTSMRAVGYRPNSAARALKYGRFHTVGVIMFTLETLGNVRTLDAIATEAAASGYSVTLMPVLDSTLGAVSGAYRRLSEQAAPRSVALRVGRGLAKGPVGRTACR